MFQRLTRRASLLLALAVALFFASGSIAPAAAFAQGSAASCVAAGTTGLTAKVVAAAGQTITGQVDATGCDVGIYVGPSARGVTIENASVSGANDHGIFVQDAFGTVIENSVVFRNGVDPTLCPSPPKQPTGPCIAEDKPIELVGTSHAVVKDNVVDGNLADGGIGVADDGATDPGALRPGTPHAAYHNLIEHNVIEANRGGGGIVLAAYNANGGLSNNVVEGNFVAKNVAGIVVATNAPHAIAQDDDVFNNTMVSNTLAGVIVHASAPFDMVSGTNIQGNILVGNGPDPSAAGGHGPKSPTGIAVVAEPLPPHTPAGVHGAQIHGTTLKGNTFVHETVTNFVFGAVATAN